MKNVKLILGILLILFITGCTKEDIDLEKLVLSGDSITYSDSERLFITESDLDLMDKLGKYTITWTSSHPNVISETGTVTRPSKEESDIEVTLKATLNGLEKTFTIKVLKMPSISDLTPLYGTYNMLFQGGSKQNGLVQSKTTFTYVKYEWVISETGITERIDYTESSQKDVTYEYPLSVFRNNPFVSENTGFSYYIDQDSKSIEISQITDTGYEVILLSNQRTANYFESNKAYRLDFNPDFNPFTDDNQPFFGVNFSNSGFSYTSYQHEQSTYSDSGYYEYSKQFIYILSSINLIYRIDGDDLIYQAENIYDHMTGTVTNTPINYRLITNQFSEKDILSFEQDEILRSELNALFDPEGSYGVAVTDGFLNSTDTYLMEDNRFLEKNLFGTFYYDPYQPGIFARYRLNVMFNQATELVPIDYGVFPFITSFKNIQGTIDKFGEVYYLKTTYGELSKLSNYFYQNDIQKDVILRIESRNHLLYIDVFDQGNYKGVIAFDFNQDLNINIDDFYTTFSNYLYPIYKPFEINHKHEFKSNGERDYYFKIELKPGSYVIDASHGFEIVDENGEPFEVNEIKHDIERGTLIHTDEDLTFYIHMINAYAFRDMYIELLETDEPVQTSMDILADTNYSVPAETIFDQYEYILIPSEDTVYKLVVTGEGRHAVKRESKEYDGYVYREDLEPLVLYTIAYANEPLKLTFYSKVDFILYTAPKNELMPVTLNTGLNSTTYFSSKVYPEITFLYTLEGDEFSIDLHYYRNEEANDLFDSDFELYNKTSSGFKVYGPDGNLASKPYKTKGTYTIVLNHEVDFFNYKIEIHTMGNLNITIETPYEQTHTLYPNYQASYQFVVTKKSFIEIEISQEELFRLIEVDTERILWNVYGKHVITLNPGTYRLDSRIQYSTIDYTLKIKNLGVSSGFAFDDDTIYTYPNSIKTPFTYTHELVRLEFTYQTYLYYEGVEFHVIGQFNPLGSTRVLQHKVWTSLQEGGIENITNIYFVSSNTKGERTIGFYKR